jgi:chlorobactene glucosyltransferase
MTTLLIISNIVLLVISLILFRNRILFGPLSEIPDDRLDSLANEDKPVVSICIPARNEEANIRRCIESLIRQDYQKYEILVLDDQSTDDTGNILSDLKSLNPGKIRIMHGQKKPDDWLGKQWACHQLSMQATGDIILFADADTWFEPQTVRQTAASFFNYDIDMLTVWPQQHLETFWENIIIPLVYYALVGFLPVHYVYRKPRWMSAGQYMNTAHLFAAACGQFIAFRNYAYQSIGGHHAVKNLIIEDVALAKLAKKNGLRLMMMHGMNSVHCRMYVNESMIRQGFQKNFLAGFGNNIPLFGISAVLHLVVFVLPFIAPLFSLQPSVLMLSGMAVLLILLHRFLLAGWFHWNPLYIFLHPLGVLWFQLLGIIVVIDYVTGRKTFWKNRQI